MSSISLVVLPEENNMPNDIASFVHLFIKIALLIMIGLYALFTLMLTTKVKSFNKVVFLPPSSGAELIQTTTTILLLVLTSLFLITLAIV